MIPVPEWAKEAVHTTVCIPCDHVYVDDDVTGIGMRHTAMGKVCLCVEVRCPRCHRQELLALTNRPMDIRAFVGEIAKLGDIKDFEDWATENATLRFYPDPVEQRRTSVHHVQTDGEGWSEPIHTELRLCSRLQPTGIVMRVKSMTAFSMRRRIADARLDVLGGYGDDGGAIILLCRLQGPAIPRNDGLLKLRPKFRALQRGFDDERLEPSDWHRFDALPSESTFWLAGRSWKKLDIRALKSVVGTEGWSIQPPRSRPGG